MNTSKYLKRIEYKGELAPNLQTLSQLQKAHLLAIPFENLDIHYNSTIELDINKIHNKIIDNKRGGFCYELNGLFYELLTALGFNVKMISARVFDKTKGYGPELDHLVLIVTINDAEYLCDVGFGEFIFRPMKIELNKVHSDPRGDFVIEQYNESYFLVNEVKDKQYLPIYIFKKAEKKLNDFKEICHYQQTNPDSNFTKKKVISRPTKNGRITLAADLLKIKEQGVATETPLATDAEFNDLLWKWFGIEM